MEFRWVAFITLWTVLSGPIFSSPSKAPARNKAVVVKTAPSTLTTTAATD